MLRYNNDLIINNVNITPYLSDYKISFNKIWGKDTGRNTMSGKYTGTLIGIFPKITCTFHKLTQNDVETLVRILDTATQTTKYYDPYTKTIRTITTYCGDYEIGQNCLFSDVARAGQSFNISFIATERRN